jgi:hypothetical protein
LDKVPGFDKIQKFLDDFMGLFKIVFGFAQVVSTLTINLPSIEWPNSLTEVWDSLAVANIDLFSALTVECLAADWSFYSTFQTTIIYPIILGLVLVFVTFVRCLQAEDEESSREVYVQAWKWSLLGMFLIYPSVSSTVLKVWHCREVEGTAYVSSDYRLVCWTPTETNSEWQMNAIIAGIAFFVYPFGIPAFYYYELTTNKDALYDEDHPDHAFVDAKLSFLYRAYEHDAWYWELVMLTQKFLLTGVLIFIKPGTTSQIAFGFVISITFFVIHVRTNAYIEDTEDDLQFAALLSITMTLFGGILLKTNTQDEDPYGAAAMSGLLFAINIGVIVIFVYQGYLAFKKPPPASRLKLQKKVAMRLVQEGIDNNRERILAATAGLGLEPAQTKAVEEATVAILGRLPVAISMMDEIDEIIDELQNGIFSLTECMGVVDSMIKVAKKIIGKPAMVKLFHPYAAVVMEELVKRLPFECSKEGKERIKILGIGISQYMVGNGMRIFLSKWIPIMEGTPSYQTVDDMFRKIDEVYGLDRDKLNRISERDLDDDDDDE